jgi:hypothetical protein
MQPDRFLELFNVATLVRYGFIPPEGVLNATGLRRLEVYKSSERSIN